MKLATWNVNGIRKRELEFVQWVQRDEPDVVCLQEIKASRDQLSEALSNLPDYWSYWHGAPGGYSGVSLHLRKAIFPDVPTFTHPAFDHETRIVEACVGARVFASVYVPNGGKDYDAKIRFMTALVTHAQKYEADGKRLLLAGDLNVALTDLDVHRSQCEAGVIGQRDEERKLLEGLVGAGLVDTARHLDPENPRLFTWWPNWKNARERNLGWRIDYILASRHEKAQAASVLRDVGTSDHAPVIVEFAE